MHYKSLRHKLVYPYWLKMHLAWQIQTDGDVIGWELQDKRFVEAITSGIILIWDFPYKTFYIPCSATSLSPIPISPG